MPRIKMTERGAGRCRFSLFKIVMALVWGMAIVPAQAERNVIEAITFDTEKGQVYVPIEDAARELNWKIEHYTRKVFLGPQKMPLVTTSMKRLTTGTELVSLQDLQKAGAELVVDQEGGPTTAHDGLSGFDVVKAAKRVEVDLTKQQLSAWEGTRLVLLTHISSGRYRNSTPLGEFPAGPFKDQMHFSKKYNNAPMPWSVQLSGQVFIHGFGSVPHYPASHGCIRMPLDGGNPAKFFYEWVDVGTPVRVFRS